jgi:hypothetical protein
MSTMVAEPYVNHVPTVLSPFQKMDGVEADDDDDMIDDRRHRQKSTNEFLPRSLYL